MINKNSILIAILSISLFACSGTNHSPMPSIDESAKLALDKPVNCGTAQRDIKILEDERASVGKQILSGVRSVFPIAAVAGILTGDYSDRFSVATGQYNSDLTAKIEQIKGACHIG